MSIQFSLFSSFASPSRTLVTPGRLYALMSTEFRKVRPEGHRGCIMPMVFRREPARRGDAQWGIQPMTSQCECCTGIALAIAQRHAEAYEMNDPVGSTYDIRCLAQPNSIDGAKLFGA
jgi:hypothetical protein